MSEILRYRADDPRKFCSATSLQEPEVSPRDAKGVSECLEAAASELGGNMGRTVPKAADSTELEETQP